ncbi:MAG: hypothetical protein H6R04_629 [Burkholderiaceae bacterium]|nr:hypothetical protein [Burkholderiaceae bacterium]
MARMDLSQQRFATLELLLLWEGVLNRSRLSSLLGVGDIRASQLIQEFRDQNPQRLRWNTKSRSYHATNAAYTAASFSKLPNDRAASLARYLALVGLPYVTGEMETIGPICAAFPELSAPSPQVFASLSQAIRTRQSVEITYRSMGNPIPHKRTLSPHHLVRAGRRWHVRAFCATHKEFRDYALGRIVDAVLIGLSSERTEIDDLSWNTQVPVQLIAHPNLSREQEDVIRFEYFSNTASCTVTSRGALVGYFVQDVRAAIDPSRQTPPDYQLAVSNLAEVKPWLFHPYR